MNYNQEQEFIRKLWLTGNFIGFLIITALWGWEFPAIMLLWYIAFIKD
jgi:hypothetical protein